METQSRKRKAWATCSVRDPTCPVRDPEVIDLVDSDSDSDSDLPALTVRGYDSVSDSDLPALTVCSHDLDSDDDDHDKEEEDSKDGR